MNREFLFTEDPLWERACPRKRQSRQLISQDDELRPSAPGTATDTACPIPRSMPWHGVFNAVNEPPEHSTVVSMVAPQGVIPRRPMTVDVEPILHRGKTHSATSAIQRA
jgi:hypothetical protein